MNEGVVKWFNSKRGYGFIQSEEFKSDIFLHHSSFVEEMTVHEGTVVLFEIENGEKGLSAKKVVLK